MARKIVKLPSMSRVTPGATATLEMPIGPTYQKIIFSTTGGVGLGVEDVKRINVLIDGKVVQTYKNLQRLIDINGYYNRETDTINEFALHFFRPEMLDAVYRRAPGFGTGDIQTFHIEVEIDAAAPADIAMVAHAEVDPMPQELGIFYKVREYPFNTSVAGPVEIDKLPRGPFYSVIHLFKADISAIEVEVDQVKVIDATKAVGERLQKGASPVKRVPMNAKATTIDLVAEGDIAQSLKTDTVQDFRIKATFDSAGAADIVTETLETIGAQ